MPVDLKKFRRNAGTVAFSFAVLFMVWLPLGFFEIVPFVVNLPNETGLRSHAGLAIASLLVAALCFWET
jgi:hypothetical protein